MPTIAAVADHIVAENLPALFVDTCILLDVVRSIKRKAKDCAAQAKTLHSAATVAPQRGHSRAKAVHHRRVAYSEARVACARA